MNLLRLLPVFLIGFSFSDAPCDLYNGIHGQYHLLAKNHEHNGLPVLKLSIPPKHPDELWVDQSWIVEISMNVVVCQCMLDVEAKSLQHPNVEEVFYVNNGFTFNVDGGGVCGDDGHGGSSVFAGICHGDLRRRLVFL